MAKPDSAGTSAGEPPVREGLADPQAVAAVRGATVWLVGLVLRGAGWAGRGLALIVRTSVTWLAPRIRPALRSGRDGAGRLVRATARSLWTHREFIGRFGHRLAWWSALAMLLILGQALLGGQARPLIDPSTTGFALGFALALVVLVRAPELRLRRASFVLASAHGCLGLLVALTG